MDAATWSIFGALLLAGLAGSLHCVGMCGPILLGFSQAFAGSNSQPAQPPHLTSPSRERNGRRSLKFDFVWYHTGRIWTYALLGFVVGLVGQGMRDGSAWLGWQRTAGIALGALTIFVGVALLGLIPAFNLDRMLNGCAFKRFGGVGWFKSLLRSRGVVPRLLLGAVMGLLPCGLVYAALLIAASLPTPWHSAAGMVIFGVGTVPSLSAVLIASRAIPTRWRAHGTRLAAALVIATGAWMVARSVIAEHDASGCGHGANVRLTNRASDAADTSRREN